MSIVIFTADDKKFRVGEYIVMHNELTYPPTAPDVTYILHSNTFKEADVITWLPVISNRLVVVCSKAPTISPKTQESVIIDSNLNQLKVSYNREIRSWFNWSDRLRAFMMARKIPIPLLLAFFRRNHISEIEAARLVADASFVLPDMYVHSILSYGVPATSGRVQYPPKTIKPKDPPSQFRLTDKYADILVRHAPEVQNMIRAADSSELPRGIPKTPKTLLEWL